MHDRRHSRRLPRGEPALGETRAATLSASGCRVTKPVKFPAEKPGPIDSHVAALVSEYLDPVKDSVNHPSHYTSGGIEVIEAIDAWKLDFALGNAVKYIARAGKKDPAKTLEDLKKARWYLDRAISKLEPA